MLASLFSSILFQAQSLEEALARKTTAHKPLNVVLKLSIMSKPLKGSEEVLVTAFGDIKISIYGPSFTVEVAEIAYPYGFSTFLPAEAEGCFRICDGEDKTGQTG
jgi:hypothetical protein